MVESRSKSGAGSRVVGRGVEIVVPSLLMFVEFVDGAVANAELVGVVPKVQRADIGPFVGVENESSGRDDGEGENEGMGSDVEIYQNEYTDFGLVED